MAGVATGRGTDPGQAGDYAMLQPLLAQPAVARVGAG